MADISRSTGSRSALRASDADRERVAAALRRHHLDGRLDTDELQDRLGACYAAKTQADLAPLLADLPGEAPPGRPARAGAPWRGPGAPLAAVLVVAFVLATAAAIAHGRPGPLPLLLVFLLFRVARGSRRLPSAWSARG
jgi:Domain of unknown function (DUF1707)